MVKSLEAKGFGFRLGFSTGLMLFHVQGLGLILVRDGDLGRVVFKV